jgi:Reverse transcriptase (RNA-dependent DNA polymerase)
MIPLPNGKKLVGYKWVYKIKCHSNGTIERYKARLVAKSYIQTYRIDYEETFAPVAKMNTIRILLSIAINQNWILHQMDVKIYSFKAYLKKRYACLYHPVVHKKVLLILFIGLISQFMGSNNPRVHGMTN